MNAATVISIRNWFGAARTSRIGLTWSFMRHRCIFRKRFNKVLIDDLLRRTEADKPTEPDQIDMFADFNGLPDEIAKTEFYQHDAHWANRMILGDSLQVMASLAER